MFTINEACLDKYDLYIALQMRYSIWFALVALKHSSSILKHLNVFLWFCIWPKEGYFLQCLKHNILYISLRFSYLEIFRNKAM